MSFLKKGVLLFLLFLFMFTFLLSVKIEKIVIKGNQRIPKSTVLYYISLREGDEYDQKTIEKDFMSLYKTGLFSDIKVDVEDGKGGKVVYFILKEKPIIRSIEYVGLKSVKKSDILDEFSKEKLGLTVDSPYDPTKIKKAEDIIKNLLILNGRPLCKIDTRIEKIPPNSVKIIFNIKEGEKVRIGKIHFVGNKVFSERKLKRTLKLTKERGFISIFKGTDKYHHDRLLYDLEENVKSLYQQYGYLDMKYGEPIVKIKEGPRGFIPFFRKTKKQFYITIPIDEGPQYKIDSISFEGNTLFKSSYFKKLLGLKKGDIANFKRVKDGIEDIKKVYEMYGYMDVSITPQTTFDRRNHTVKIKFVVNQGKQYRVNKIEFFGNTKTHDKVLRREFRLIEQDVFSKPLLDLSIQRINQLGLFEKITDKDYEIRKNPDEATVDIDVHVKEKGQQSIGFTGGISGYQGSFFGLNYTTNNFLGYGDSMTFDATFGTRMVDFTFSFTDPYFLDTNTLFGFSVFNRRYDFNVNDYTYFYSENAEQLYRRKSTGFSITIGRYFKGFWKYTITYRFQNFSFPLDSMNPDYKYLVESQIYWMNPGLPIDKALSGLKRSEITPILSYNSTDDFFFPTKGTDFSAGVSIAGGFLQGDFNIYSPFIEYKHYLKDRWLSGGRNVLAFRFRTRFVSTFGDTKAIPFFDRYFLGGEYDMRGFDIRGISPYAIISSLIKDNQGNVVYDPDTGLPERKNVIQPIGGDWSTLFSFEYRIPLVGPITLVSFFDSGMTTVVQHDKLGFSPDTRIFLINDTNRKIRSSTGFEFQFMMPMINAPFRLIFAYNVKRLKREFVIRDYGYVYHYREPKTTIQFSIGKSF